MLRLQLSWLCLLTAITGASAEEPKPGRMPYVEFDFRPLPQEGKGTYKLQFTILTADKDIKFSEPIEFARGTDTNTNCEFLAAFLNRNKFKAKVVDKTKLRVYGRIFNDKLIPATKG